VPSRSGRQTVILVSDKFTGAAVFTKPLVKEMVANSSAVMLDLQGAICTSVPSLSVIHDDGVESLIFWEQSNEVNCYRVKTLSGIGSGCRGLAGLDVWPLLH